MSSPYTSVSVSNYNQNPPSDDGSTAVSNQLSWDKHKTKLSDPLKIALESINTNVAAAFNDTMFHASSSITGTYSVVAGDRGKMLYCTNTFTLTLLAAATAGDGFNIGISNSGSGTITVDGNASETINGSATITLEAGEGCILCCDGSNWNGHAGIIGATTAIAGKLEIATDAEAQAETATDKALVPSNLAALPAAVTGYQGGKYHQIYDDQPDATLFEVIAPLTVSTWESVGPTSSGADNIWSSLDDLPSTATSIIIRTDVLISGSTSGDTYRINLFSRPNGSATAAATNNIIAKASFVNRSGSVEGDQYMSDITIPVSSSQMFDLYYTIEGTTPSSTIYFWLVGWIE